MKLHSQRSRRRALLVAVLLSTAIALGAMPGLRLVQRLARDWQSERLYEEWQEIRKDRAVSKVPPASNEPVGWLRIPGSVIETLVVFDATDDNLSRYPCLHVASRAPDAPAIIIAHRDTHFRGLRHMSPGDEVEFESSDPNSLFRVRETRVIDPGEIPAMLSEGRPGELILLTCWPFDFIGPAPQRIAYIAEPSIPESSPAARKSPATF
jgi:sortase A